MKRKILLTGFLAILPLMVSAQMVINNFDAVPDTTYWNVYTGNDTRLDITLEETYFHEGEGALRLDWKNRCFDQYGGWIGMTHLHPDSNRAYDFSPYTHISLWYYNLAAQSKPGKVEFRICLREGGKNTNWATDEYEIWFSHHLILDDQPGWNKISVEMKDKPDAGVGGANMGIAFWAPGWGQTAAGDFILDLTKIRGWTLEFSQDGSLWTMADDSVTGVLIIDEFQLEGVNPIPVVFFNGMNVPGGVSMGTGWSGAVEITDEEFYSPDTKSIKWTTGSGWDGVVFTLEETKNMTFVWPTDSVQFAIKAPAGLGDLTLIFADLDEDGATKVDYDFRATYLITEAAYGWDDTWKLVKVPLSSFNVNSGVWDGDLGQSVAGTFDPSLAKNFYITGNGQAFDGMTVYLSNVWTGNPVFDWIAPEAVTGVDGIPGEYFNLVIWQDVDQETGESYTIYASPQPIVDLNAAGVELVGEGILEDIQTFAHSIEYPLVDTDITYYYAVVCVDASGNVGEAGVSGSVVNTARGVPTIAFGGPANFAADGDLSEWVDAGIMPWVIKPETHTVSTGTVDDSTDLKGTVYLAADDDYLYVGVDAIDNVFHYSAVGNWYDQDAFQIYIGLYDERGARHTSWQRGTEPDNSLAFMQDRFFYETKAVDIYHPGVDENYYFEEFGGADYVLEAKIPWDSLLIGADVRFHPKNGMRIGTNIYFHDNDGAGWEGNMGLSPNSTDLDWKDPQQWTFVWIGDTTDVIETGVTEETNTIPTSYELSQNYPNPFNPSTTIHYAIPKSGHVRMVLYNTFGQELKVMVDGEKSAGQYKIELNASDLASGIYFYRIQAGDFSQKRKMVLMR